MTSSVNVYSKIQFAEECDYFQISISSTIFSFKFKSDNVNVVLTSNARSSVVCMFKNCLSLVPCKTGFYECAYVSSNVGVFTPHRLIRDDIFHFNGVQKKSPLYKTSL